MSDSGSPVEPAQPYKTPSSAAGGAGPTSEEQNLAMLAHLTGGLGILLSGLGGFIGPLVIWMLKKDESAFVADQAKEALNFQITLLIIYAVTVVLAIVTCGFGALLVVVPGILQVVFAIIASLSLSKGIPYRYPFCLRLVT